MPTLLRFLAVVLVLGAIVYGAMFALATFYEPKGRDTVLDVRATRLAR